MTFQEKIASLRKGASEAQSASKIIDKLKALKDNNSPDTSYRWIWELIQNAKDVIADVAKTHEEDKEQEKRRVDDFVSETSIYLFKVRLTLEKILSTLCEKLSYTGIPNTHRMLAHVVQSGLIDKKIADYISQVNAICNRGIHGEIISDEYIQLVEAIFPKILSELNAITSRLGYKYYFVCPRCKFSGYSDCENECPVCKFVSDEY